MVIIDQAECNHTNTTDDLIDVGAENTVEKHILVCYDCGARSLMVEETTEDGTYLTSINEWEQ